MTETDLANRVAIVTGGGTGIGKAISQSLANEGAYVVVCGRRIEPLEETVGQIVSLGGKAHSHQLDVSSDVQVAELVDRVLLELGRVDILVNNAGISGGGYIHEHDVKVWDDIVAINLRGPFLMARAVLPLMRGQKSGHILNISSESGFEYYPGDGAYGVTKHALNALGEFIQRENQDLGIRVDTICPGMVVTPMSKGSAGLDEEKCLYPEDVAELALWLLSRRVNVKIGRPVLIQTMQNPWQ
ncbi:MAG TPA: SDR family oxidoreductase [candidate division Zixibacteria bacterium]|nr:SDR family oxidoreductase [candidate division Zixibacteria bacterium]